MVENNNTMRYSLSWMDMSEYDVVVVVVVAMNDDDDQLYAEI